MLWIANHNCMLKGGIADPGVELIYEIGVFRHRNLDRWMRPVSTPCMLLRIGGEEGVYKRICIVVQIKSWTALLYRLDNLTQARPSRTNASRFWKPVSSTPFLSYDISKKFLNIDDLQDGLKDYVHYYNNDRIKLRLRGLSSVQYRKKYKHH
jgi:transposase InsO family protein